MSKINENTYRKNAIDLSAGEVRKLVFNDSLPNSVFIMNYGNGDVYVSTNSNPSVSNYESMVASKARQSLVKPIPFREVYLFSASNVHLDIESFYVEDLKPADIPETQPIVFINTNPITLGSISAINTPVDIVSMASILTKLDSMLTKLDSQITLLTAIRDKP
jgi:hypothetical protein